MPEVAEWSLKIKCFFSYFQDNYWLCNNTTWRERSSLDLDSNEDWIKFVADLDGGGEQGGNRELNNMTAREYFNSNSFDILRTPNCVREFSSLSVPSPFDNVQDGNKRLLLAPQQWLEDLQVPQDAYDLLYRLGQKSVQFDRMKVHYVILMDLLSAKVHVVHFHETHHIHDW